MFGNWFKTSLLMAAIMALFGMVGALLGGAQGMLLALALGLATNLWAYWFSDTMVLRLYNAREVDAASAPALYATVRELTSRAGLPMPRVYLIDEAQPNAFATGRSPEHAALAADHRHPAAPDCARVARCAGARARARAKSRHTHFPRSRRRSPARSPRSRTSACFSDATMTITGIHWWRYLCLSWQPIAALLIQLAISRGREYEADHTGAEISGDPRALADALAKIDRYAKGLPLETAEAHPATAQMMIVNPLQRRGHRRALQHASADRGAHPPAAGSRALAKGRAPRWRKHNASRPRAVRRVLAGVALGGALDEAGASEVLRARPGYRSCLWRAQVPGPGARCCPDARGASNSRHRRRGGYCGWRCIS